MPTIVLIKDGRTDHSIMGFDEFGGTDDFTTDDVAFVLSRYGVLEYSGPDRDEEVAERSAKANVNAIRMSRIRAGDYDDLSDEDD